MKVIVKIGGAALENRALLLKCARALADLAQAGHRIAVVHGGGAALTRTLGHLGKKSEFIDGLRVSDPETRDVALMVLAGSVNKMLVAAMSLLGQPAIGLCGGDGLGFRARKKRIPGCDLGFVGEISAVDPHWIEAIWNAGGIPVLASLALGADGEYYNINADQMASACAAGCRADVLIFVTDVAGVMAADGTTLRWLDIRDIPHMVRDTTVSGGMLPKLEACQQALRRGVSRVRIMPAASVEQLPQFFVTRIDVGTEVLAS